MNEDVFAVTFTADGHFMFSLGCKCREGHIIAMLIILLSIFINGGVILLDELFAIAFPPLTRESRL